MYIVHESFACMCSGVSDVKQPDASVGLQQPAGKRGCTMQPGVPPAFLKFRLLEDRKSELLVRGSFLFPELQLSMAEELVPHREVGNNLTGPIFRQCAGKVEVQGLACPAAFTPFKSSKLYSIPLHACRESMVQLVRVLGCHE